MSDAGDDALLQNGILAALPEEERSWLRPRLAPVAVPRGQTFYVTGGTILEAYFPISGWVSIVARLEDGSAVEVGLIGREGMAGLPLIYGTDRAASEAMCQADCTALRLSARDLRQALDECPTLQARLLRFAMAFSRQVAQTAACNSRHTVEQRLARWLLMARDRGDGDRFPLTHEFMSMMLGVRRAGVTVAAGDLQRRGLVRYRPGVMTIVDREGLEGVACGCHAAVRAEYDRLLGPSSGLAEVPRE